MSSDFLNAPAVGWNFPALPAETPIRALPLAPTPATLAHQQEAARLVSDALSAGGRLNAAALVDAVAHALALRDEAAASLDASNQVIIADLRQAVRVLRVVAGLPEEKTPAGIMSGVEEVGR